MIEAPLGLSAEHLAALRKQYVIESLPEGVFLTGIEVVILVSPILGILCALTWLGPHMENKQAARMIAVLAGVVTFVGSCAFAGTLTSGFWD